MSLPSSSPSPPSHLFRLLFAMATTVDLPLLDSRVFVGDVDDFLCVVCSEVMEQAVTLPCRHEFCAVCIAHHRSRSPSASACPSCRQAIPPSYVLVPAYKTRSKIDGLQVHCRFFEQDGTGCEFVTALQRVVAHESTCAFREEKCVLCAHPVVLSEMQEHMTAKCVRRLIPCDDCRTKIAVADMPKHV